MQGVIRLCKRGSVLNELDIKFNEFFLFNIGERQDIVGDQAPSLSRSIGKVIVLEEKNKAGGTRCHPGFIDNCQA